MKIKKKCQQCNKTFEAKRNDTLYCSSACKQNAHYVRAINKAQKGNETAKPIFYFEEYQEGAYDTGNITMDIITFFFLRKELKGNPNVDEICEFILAHYDENMGLESIKKSKAFDEFKEKYLGGEFEILAKKPLIQ